MQPWAFIPARRASQRYPNKVMANLRGKPLVLHTFESVQAVLGEDQCFILVDDQENYTILRRYTDAVLMTAQACRNGTERCAEAVKLFELEADAVVLNIQADEPLVQKGHIEALLRPFVGVQKAPRVSTILYEWPLEEVDSEHQVKVVTDENGFCLGFYRHLPPYLNKTADRVFLHGGFYGYSAQLLLEYAKWPVDTYEAKLHLEQLRFLKHNISVFGNICDQPTIGVDIPEDLARVEEKLK